MMNSMHQFWNRGKDNINDNIDDLHRTKWLSVFLKGAMITLLTIVVLFFITQTPYFLLIFSKRSVYMD